MDIHLADYIEYNEVLGELFHIDSGFAEWTQPRSLQLLLKAIPTERVSAVIHDRIVEHPFSRVTEKLFGEILVMEDFNGPTQIHY